LFKLLYGSSFVVEVIKEVTEEVRASMEANELDMMTEVEVVDIALSPS